MPKTIGNVELYMGPPGVRGPDDLEKAIVDYEFEGTPLKLPGSLDTSGLQPSKSL